MSINSDLTLTWAVIFCGVSTSIFERFQAVNEDLLWIMAVEWFYLLLKPLLLALVDHVVFTCFQVSLH